LNAPPLRVVALVSIGRHPVSGRPRRSPLDARAVEMGLRLAGKDLLLLHAGDPDSTMLREYLGMGASAVEVLRTTPEQDVVPALAVRLQALKPQLVLTGLHAEGGEDSGLVPYMLAQNLAVPVITNAADLSVSDGHARVLQALPRGRRRELEVLLPCIVAFGNSAPAPRASAYGPARRAAIVCVESSAATDERLANWQESPARARPKCLRIAGTGRASDRLAAATAVSSAGGTVLHPETPQQSARAILDFLKQVGVR